MGEVIEYKSENGYTGKLYGKSSLSIYNSIGREVMHTCFRRINTLEELKEEVEEFPEFLRVLSNREPSDED